MSDLTDRLRHAAVTSQATADRGERMKTQRQELTHNDNKCIFCGEHVDQYDATAGGADSNYSKGAAAEFDYPAVVTCEGPEDGPFCGATYCDGDLVERPEGR